MFQSCVRSFWPNHWLQSSPFASGCSSWPWPSAIEDGAAAGSESVGFTAVLSVILGCGLGKLRGVKAAQQTAIQNGRDTAKTTVDSQATAWRNGGKPGPMRETAIC